MQFKDILKFMFVVLLAIGVFSCKKDKPDDFKADDAKVEVRNGVKQVTQEAMQVYMTPAVQSLSFLADLLDVDIEFNQHTLNNLLQKPGKISLTKIKKTFAANSTTFKSGNEDIMFGIFEFNFETEEFDFTPAAGNSMTFLFPSGTQSLADEINDAQIEAKDIDVQTILVTETYYDEWLEDWVTETYEEVVPTKFNANMEINNSSVMTANYSAALGDHGLPTAASVVVAMSPYNLSLTLTGSGRNYVTEQSMKKGDQSLAKHNLELTYTSDLEGIEKLKGQFIVEPLKIDGYANVEAIDEHMEIFEETGQYDIGFLNSQMDLDLIHTVENAKLGDIEFKAILDPYYGVEVPTLVLVYEDGSYELFEDIMEIDFKFARVGR